MTSDGLGVGKKCVKGAGEESRCRVRSARSWTDYFNDLRGIMYRQEVVFMAVRGNEPAVSRKIGPCLFFFFFVKFLM